MELQRTTRKRKRVRPEHSQAFWSNHCCYQRQDAVTSNQGLRARAGASQAGRRTSGRSIIVASRCCYQCHPHTNQTPGRAHQTKAAIAAHRGFMLENWMHQAQPQSRCHCGMALAVSTHLLSSLAADPARFNLRSRLNSKASLRYVGTIIVKPIHANPIVITRH